MAKRKLKALVHSASSIALANRCHRAWWLRYREGIKPPELTWRQVSRRKAAGRPLPKGAYSKALGTEVHRLAELYLTLSKREAAKLIDWNDLPGQCLQALVPLLPPAGSVHHKDVEQAVTVEVKGVKFRGLIDVVGAALRAVVESWDHKTSRDIREYALLPHSLAVKLKQPKRSLRDDIQACMYTLAQAARTGRTAGIVRGDEILTASVAGGICRWNYTETQRSRRSLPVVQYIPTAHARRVVEGAADVAREVAAFKTIEDAVPNTLACDDYGGCWYRDEGHCSVRRKWGAIIVQSERTEKEKEGMQKIKSFKDLENDTAEANEAEEREARKAAKAASKRKPAPEPEEDDEDDSEEEEDEAPESKPAPRKSKPSKGSKRKPEPEEDDEDEDEDEDEDDSEDEAPESEPAPKPKAKSPRAAAQAAFDAAVPHDAVLAHFDRLAPNASPQAVAVLGKYRSLAQELATVLKPENLDRAVTLRRLLEARDAAVHALETEGVGTLEVPARKSKRA